MTQIKQAQHTGLPHWSCSGNGGPHPPSQGNRHAEEGGSFCGWQRTRRQRCEGLSMLRPHKVVGCCLPPHAVTHHPSVACASLHLTLSLTSPTDDTLCLLTYEDEIFRGNIYGGRCSKTPLQVRSLASGCTRPPPVGPTICTGGTGTWPPRAPSPRAAEIRGPGTVPTPTQFRAWRWKRLGPANATDQQSGLQDPVPAVPSCPSYTCKPHFTTKRPSTFFLMQGPPVQINSLGKLEEERSKKEKGSRDVWRKTSYLMVLLRTTH